MGNKWTDDEIKAMMEDYERRGSPPFQFNRIALPKPSDAVDQAITNAIMHGTGAFRVHADGSVEHVDLHDAETEPR